MLFCFVIAVLLARAWLRNREPASLFVTFICVTNSVPGHRGPHAVFAITNRSSSAVALPFGGSLWSYKDAKRSVAWQDPMGTNTLIILKPGEGCIMTFGEATNAPCR